MQRQVKWLGQVETTQWVACDAARPCPDGFTCVNGACVKQQLNANLLRNIAPVAPKKSDNTVLWILGGTIVLGTVYYAMK